ncbi:nucleotidyl transferase AbiEii/AbiGii toxin family protein [Corynebacterium diphtheriae]|uniref:nucleotidyl transferase AbiEii/AbiGii toxin family protein n=1 Tax=Corynebacterium diphtheriae TaxID=1717 RepID=UPI0002469566|nr:nucleotidyl transferase AbiEii/AbiGii toxin family protein [Corynebacterium diphtheriae]KLN37158.1 hypothetical protein AL07_10680 [Corynebacterium diphtheriae bv. gravis str. ISS 4060]MBG9263640.1 nucleotidyl transferase AbiEii/AbiGii toxin family protein [Corynebacterium diphtheriae bv. gravis]OWN01884.1 hypothetical protein AY476_07385 [Corynebacterium diphtheriae bv. mitis]OWN11093.1 hypothetical protein AY479_07000 [Corynebacterium belfantii]AEX70821.1 hypothetical protein CDPW8_2178 [
MDRTRGSFKVVLRIGTQQVVSFSVDISTQQHLDALIDFVKINPVIEYQGLPSGAVIRMVPVENVAADKLCACYELHWGEPSTRYHGLIDLVRIVTSQSLDAKLLQTLMTKEATHRGLNLPEKIITQVRGGVRLIRNKRDKPLISLWSITILQPHLTLSEVAWTRSLTRRSRAGYGIHRSRHGNPDSI